MKTLLMILTFVANSTLISATENSNYIPLNQECKGSYRASLSGDTALMKLAPSTLGHGLLVGSLQFDNGLPEMKVDAFCFKDKSNNIKITLRYSHSDPSDIRYLLGTLNQATGDINGKYSSDQTGGETPYWFAKKVVENKPEPCNGIYQITANGIKGILGITTRSDGLSNAYLTIGIEKHVIWNQSICKPTKYTGVFQFDLFHEDVVNGYFYTRNYSGFIYETKFGNNIKGSFKNIDYLDGPIDPDHYPFLGYQTNKRKKEAIK